MNLLLFHGREVVEGQLALPALDRRREHLRLILGLKAGDRVRVGRLHGPSGWATLAEDPAVDGPLHLLLDAMDAPAPPSDATRVLILALPRPPVLKRVLELAPQLDLHRLVLVRSARVEKSYFHSPLLSQGLWRRHLELGMEQARHTRQPQVLIFERFRPFVEDHLEQWLPGQAPRLLPHPGPWPGMASLDPGAVGSWVLAVGPEGGWVEAEVEAFRSQRFQTISLGPRILRVESAVHRLVAQLDLLQDMKSGALS